MPPGQRAVNFDFSQFFQLDPSEMIKDSADNSFVEKIEVWGLQFIRHYMRGKYLFIRQYMRGKYLFFKFSNEWFDFDYSELPNKRAGHNKQERGRKFHPACLTEPRRSLQPKGTQGFLLICGLGHQHAV